MSGLREAIADAIITAGHDTSEDFRDEALRQADAVLPLFEAYLREHDAQVKQRIEALRQGVAHDYDWALGYSAALDDALEALGGSDDA